MLVFKNNKWKIINKWRNLVYIMRIKKQASPFCNMSDEQLIFFCFDNFDYQVKMDSPKDKSIFESSKGVFTYNKPFL